MFLYSWLHMSGYDIPMSEVKNFRQHHSATPGHPEFPNSEHNTPGIEATTGPLGQGVVNAAGIAAAQKMEQAMFNTKDHEIFNSVSVALCGDGCLQEGVSAEGAQFAVSRLLLVPCRRLHRESRVLLQSLTTQQGDRYECILAHLVVALVLVCPLLALTPCAFENKTSRGSDCEIVEDD